ncbi:MAG: hypothetical protein ACFFG0_38495 [Candidatus Thorarchaeota archaeon]
MSIRYDEWNEWTQRSEKVSFDYKPDGVGKGEYKLAAEFDTIPLGQNATHDLDINNEKWECKALDTDGSFRLGVEISDQYQPFRRKVLRIFDKVGEIIPILNEDHIKTQMENIKSMIDTPSGRSKYNPYEGLIRSEVSESNLNQINSIVNELSDIINLTNPLSQTQIFDPTSGEQQTTSPEIYYKTLKSYGVSEEFLRQQLGENYNITIIKSELQDMMQEFSNESILQKLTRFVRDFFRDKVLVLVHEQYGYKPTTQIDNIECYRITHGNPRCKYIEQYQSNSQIQQTISNYLNPNQDD